MRIAVKDKISGKLIGNISKDITDDLNNIKIQESVNIDISSEFEIALQTELNIFIWDDFKNLKPLFNKYCLSV